MLVCSKHMMSKFRLGRPDKLIYLQSNKAEQNMKELFDLFSERPPESQSQAMLIDKINEFKVPFGELRKELLCEFGDGCKKEYVDWFNFDEETKETSKDQGSSASKLNTAPVMRK